MKYPLTALLLALATVATAAPPQAPAVLAAPAGKVKEFVVKPDGPAGKPKDVAFRYVGPPAALREMKSDTPGERVFWLVPETDGPGFVVWWTVGERASVVTEVNKVMPVPPKPPDPPAPPDPPTPPAPPGFRVIFVYESADPMPPAVQRVLFGEKVVAYLDAKALAWRRFDKDVTGDTERNPEIKALWQGARQRLPQVPCVVISSGGETIIAPLPASEEDALKLFQKYGG